jgi:hypothetical protein
MELHLSTPNTSQEVPTSKTPHEVTFAGKSETHIALIESVEPHYRSFALDHCTQLIKEYECTTSSDVALCELAAGAMARHLSATQKLQYLRDENWTTTNRRSRTGSFRFQKQEEEWTTVRDHLHRIEIESKEIDRSLRQYQGIISQLSQRKSPMTEVHIKTAFVAQNQQFNAPKTV